MIKLKFEENLRDARKQYGYLQEELADKLNVSRQVVSKCTKGAQSGKMEVPILNWMAFIGYLIVLLWLPLGLYDSVSSLNSCWK